MKNYKIVIGGCRDYNNYTVFKAFVTQCLSQIKHTKNISIISGHCSGVDTMAEQFAKEHQYPIEIYPAEWKKYGRAAGPKRNRIMVDAADMVIAFWDKKSKGTKSLLEYAQKEDKKIYIKFID